ncbi:MAG: energy transducer TonB [Prevotellaceae bacterium]|jgi:protein TonB|nr:energy transducer TonB [Prevotellaceae bacterium]
MRPKKTKQKDLENKKFVFFEIGLAIVLLITFLAFEWQTVKHISTVNVVESDYVEPIAPVTIDEQPKPEPLPNNKKLAMLFTDAIEITDIDLDPFILFVDPALIDTTQYKKMVPKIVEPEREDTEEVFPIYSIQQKPTFHGHEPNAFVSWIYSQLEYPEEAMKNNLEGIVYLSFVIGKDGKLMNIQSLSKTDPILVNEVIRVVKSSPDWEPGMQGIRKVNVHYQLSIRFKLQN